MPRPKSLDQYPSEYFNAFREAIRTGSFTIHTNSAQAARLLRAHLYVFRRVMVNTLTLEDSQVASVEKLRFEVDGGKLIISLYQQPGVTEIKEALDASTEG